MRSLITLLALATLLAGTRAGVAQSSRPAHDPPSGTLLSISMDADEVKLDSPILVKVVLTNNSDHQLLVFREKSGGDTQVEVRDGKRNLAADTEFGYARNGHADINRVSPKDLAISGGWIPVEPGKTLTYNVDVSKRYDLHSPGKYTIQIQRFDEDGKKLVKSNVISVTVMAK